MFQHDGDTNRLRLAPGAKRPWVRHACAGDSANTWVFCDGISPVGSQANETTIITIVPASLPDCHDRWLRPTGSKRSHGHITYRDKASQGMCKSARPSLQDTIEEAEEPRGVAPQSTDDTPEASALEPDLPGEEALFVCEPDAESAPEGMEDDVDEAREPPDESEHGSEMQDGEGGSHGVLEETPRLCLQEERRPSLDEYKQKWNRLEQYHTRPVKGAFGHGNLVPKPVPQLFQNCPWVPFDVLTADGASDEAHARLSRCFPISGLQLSSMADGVERYAHCQGEVNFRRRAPMQVAATLGFVLGTRTGRFLKGLKPKELDAIHEILNWGRLPLNNKILEAG